MTGVRADGSTFAHEDIKPPLIIGDKCVICGRGNAGKHYGIQSCLGCKTFFRRAVIQNRKYYCENNLQCDTTEKKGRGPCAACRLNRCFLAGMTKFALHGKRDIILPKGIRESPKSNTSCSSRSSSVDDPSTSSDSMAPLSPNPDGIRAITHTDQALRRRKLERFQATSEARKLACAVIGRTDPPFFYFTGLRIVDTVELAGLTSMDMYSMVEWASTLSFFPKLTVAHRAATLRQFAHYQLVIETGYCTALSNMDDVWMMPNGTCMPRDVQILPEESQKIVTPARKWRQEKLYREMTNSQIDDVAIPMRRLNILPEELATLKVVVICQCSSTVCHSVVDDEALAEASLKLLDDYKNSVFEDLFRFYRGNGLKDFEERFGNLLLLISGIVSTAAFLHESYQVMRVFGIVPFDQFTERVLFSSEKSEQ